MKTKVFVLSLLVMAMLGLASCRGAAAKKAIQYGGKALKSMKSTPKPSATTAANAGRAAIVASKNVQLCPECNGHGSFTCVDQYQNPIRDSRGDIIYTRCARCEGTGVISKK